MVTRPTAKETIESSLMELLQTNKIDDVTVPMIAKNCGITSRAFYYHYKDKHDAVSSIYIRAMNPYLNASLEDWYVRMTDVFVTHKTFMENTLCYMGQNCLVETIVDVDWKKLVRHIKPEAKAIEETYLETIAGIEYMLYGNVGTLRNSLTVKNKLYDVRKLYELRGNSWNVVAANMPPILHQTLSMEPIELAN